MGSRPLPSPADPQHGSPMNDQDDPTQPSQPGDANGDALRNNAPEVEATEPVDRQAMPADAEATPRLPFPVVGIGASAGGLNAIIEFIAAMRPDSGMAFVFIQHLPPDHESMMAD